MDTKIRMPGQPNNYSEAEIKKTTREATRNRLTSLVSLQQDYRLEGLDFAKLTDDDIDTFIAVEGGKFSISDITAKIDSFPLEIKETEANSLRFLNALRRKLEENIQGR